MLAEGARSVWIDDDRWKVVNLPCLPLLEIHPPSGETRVLQFVCSCVRVQTLSKWGGFRFRAHRANRELVRMRYECRLPSAVAEAPDQYLQQTFETKFYTADQ